MAKALLGVTFLIVGWAVGPTLETVYPLEALKMAYKSIDEETAKGLIHHSDRGSQYCSQNYVSILKSHGSQISMTQTGDPLENAIAERANGILKTEWLYRMTIPTRKVCFVLLLVLQNSISLYSGCNRVGWLYYILDIPTFEKSSRLCVRGTGCDRKNVRSECQLH